jgi:hypothetical protein
VGRIGKVLKTPADVMGRDGLKSVTNCINTGDFRLAARLIRGRNLAGPPCRGSPAVEVNCKEVRYKARIHRSRLAFGSWLLAATNKRHTVETPRKPSGVRLEERLRMRGKDREGFEDPSGGHEPGWAEVRYKRHKH